MPLVGLISDTHDNREKVLRAVRVFTEKSVDLVLHAGDHIAPFSVTWYSGLPCKLIGVLGNLDAEAELLRERYNEIGFELLGDFGVVGLGSMKIALIHGKNETLVNALSKAGFDVVVRGHTHKTALERRGNSLLVNPGEACGYLTDRATIALLDVATREVEFVELR